MEVTAGATPEVEVGAVRSKPLTARQKRRIERAVDLAEAASGMQFCVYVGPGEQDLRAQAETILADRGLDVRPSVLVLVAPQQRHFEIVTSPAARERLSDQACALAAVSMTASFRVGDVSGGIAEGLRLLAQYAGPGTSAGVDLPDVLYAPTA